ncbi:MAG TPA: SDR family NAD(P)-dependent oxidoreductase, partial [Terriglobales bacterium]|nr:SDR family NAD(P)-dependent oxidoreductase [Terriglobales bacterium]
MSSLKGRIALVTGANGGLGTSVTQALLEAGATVIGIARKIDASEFPGLAFSAISADITSAQMAKKVVADIVGHHGKIDILAH